MDRNDTIKHMFADMLTRHCLKCPRIHTISKNCESIPNNTIYEPQKINVAISNKECSSSSTTLITTEILHNMIPRHNKTQPLGKPNKTQPLEQTNKKRKIYSNSSSECISL
jgi:hypothetical protein